MLIRKISVLTNKEHEMDLPVTQEQWDRWQSGKELIQDVFPDLTPAQREFLMTGSTQEEWDDEFLG